ncbi:MAG: hypothetical protein GKR94_00335 [Gammaproteobacteria bacterium]|nr:hypothetical protein [Gammaproteobacteria bacterium]
MVEERPYLAAPAAVNHDLWFAPMGIKLRLLTNSDEVAAAAHASFSIYGEQAPEGAPDFCLRLFEHDIDDGVLGNPLFRIEGPLVYQTTGRDSVLIIDRNSRSGFGYFSSTTLANQAFFRWHFLDFAVYFALEWRGFIGVHGAAICKDGQALLLRAPSGHGKTTLAYAAARRRFQALAEDAVWIDVSGGRWWGLPSPFHMLADARTLFPELAHLPAAAQINGEVKLAVDLQKMRPGCTATCAPPGRVVLLERAPGGISSLSPCDPDIAYNSWLAGAAIKEAQALGYEAAIRDLLANGAFTLRFGDDIEAALDLLEPLFDQT